MESLYKDGENWMLNGGIVPSGFFRLSVVGEYVALLGGQTGDRIDDYALATTISKNAENDKYESVLEFYTDTALFYTKSQIDTGHTKLPMQSTGYGDIRKFGENLAVLVGAPADIWEFGGEYPYDDYGTAPILYLSSSDIADTQEIAVQGLDIDGYEVIQTKALTGQDKVLLDTPLWRVYRLANEGDEDIEGTVYCHTDASPTNGVPLDANVRAIINNGNNQTLMALLTIPKGKVGFLYRGEVGVSLEGNAAALAEYALVRFKSRRSGKIFKIKKSITLMVSQGSYSDKRTWPDPIPALTDIKISIKNVSANMGLWATLDVSLVDENKFPQEYLTSIGQP